ncbi:MAG: hypothetical protein ACETWK_00660 [Candidatus Aminicenantaceae bacterium]
MITIISYIALILLSLVGYSAGVTIKAGKRAELKPLIIDLIIVIFIWTGAVYSRVTLDFSKWILILIWIILGIIIGMITVIPRRVPEEKHVRKEEREVVPRSPINRFWTGWKNFSKKIGIFQSRIILSLFYFLFVSPFALALKIFSDPLRIKPHRGKSFWLIKKDIREDFDQFRRQF